MLNILQNFRIDEPGYTNKTNVNKQLFRFATKT